MTSEVQAAPAIHPAYPAVSHARWLIAILLIGTALRLLFILVLDPRPSLAGGDVEWYLRTGRELVTGALDHPIQPGPTFLVYNGLVQLLFPADPVQTLRLFNVAWHGLLIFAVYVIGLRYFTPHAARLAALIVAVSPAFVIEAGAPLTESLFMALLFGALALYAARQDVLSSGAAALVGLLLGLGALTRAVLLAFPLALVAHMLWLYGRQGRWRRGLRLVGALVVAYALTVSTWTVYNLVRWNRFLIAAEGLTAFAWMGATGVTDPFTVDQQIGIDKALQEQRDSAFISGFLERLTRDLPGWIASRLGNLGGAYLQPHNTVYFPGESLKELTANWLANDRSIAGLLRLTQGDAFWPKLILYLFHFWALLCGAAGMALYVRRFWRILPAYGFIAYLTAVHAVLLALPRYLFPMQPLFYLFAAAASIGLVWRARPRAAVSTPQA